MCFLSDFKACRNILWIALSSFCSSAWSFFQQNRLHPAADINANQIGYDFVGYRHGGAYRATCAGMRVGMMRILSSLNQSWFSRLIICETASFSGVQT
jgi:hypothetical protein